MAIVLGGAEKRGCARLRELAKYPFWQLTVARLRRDGCLAPTHTQLLESTEIITCQGGEQRSGRDPGPAEIEAIYEHRLDFLLDLSIDDVLAQWRDAARYGVWRFFCNDGGNLSDGSAGFRSFLRRDAVVEVILGRMTEIGRAEILRGGYWAVMPHSFIRTINTICSECGQLPTMACADILAGRYATGGEISFEPAAREVPCNWPVLKSFAYATRSYLADRLELAFFNSQWNIGLLQGDEVNPFANCNGTPVRWFPEVPAPRFAADPFVVCHNGAVTLLGEVPNEDDMRGVIGAWRLEGDEIIPLGSVIEEPNVHLSYPYVFRWRGAIYCLPERSEAGGPILYRAVEFPRRWERVACLLPGIKAVDPTVFEHDGYWWLACTDLSTGEQSHLLLWYASEPVGPWRPHVLNPVRIDPRNARGAGPPFVHRGCLIRPAQDCSVTYGRKLVFNRVIVLTPEQYDEEVVGELAPYASGSYPDGLHTLSRDGGVTAIDGLRLVFDPLAWLRKLHRRRLEAIRRQRAVQATNAPGMPYIITSLNGPPSR